MAYQGNGMDGVVMCLDCGSLVADGWQLEHTKFHNAPKITVDNLAVVESPDVDRVAAELYARLGKKSDLAG